jgi:hypothetical protein
MERAHRGLQDHIGMARDGKADMAERVGFSVLPYKQYTQAHQAAHALLQQIPQQSE